MTQPLDPQRTTDSTPGQASPEPTLDPVATPTPRVVETGSPPGGETMPTCPPAAVEEGATLPPAAVSMAQPGPGPVSVPGYEILGELGRGGMGVVYRARQIKANRLVALKMILVGGHAGAEGLARFQTEAQAIAALQHPHIVQVFEVGEHDGLPFFSLEFCSGGSLEKKLAGTPLPPREAARLVEALARAMAAAHQAGVIHRDLKPANVLLLEDGTPRITDFGLAKKLDDAVGPTQEGAIMGTPSYMAPEQAGGKSKDIGPAADIYALGAILYECLTGRPPFKAATSLDTILQVIADEPVPPSQLQSKTPRDLETICLKCLHKDPARRYDSALSLADDLGRYQRGEPIAARPVGRLERGWRWCRRNPAVASLSAVAMLAMLAGTAISWAFAVEGNRRAEAEASAKIAAVAARNDLEKANTDLTRSQEALLKSTDSLVTSVARSLLRPLAVQAQPRQRLPPLSDSEVEVLWELATSQGERFRLRFVAEALSKPVWTRQLKDRAAVALHAAVGLDRTRRAQAERLLGEHLLAAGITQGQQEHVALTLAHLGVQDRPLARKVAAILTEAMSKMKLGYASQPLSQGVSAVATRLEPKEGAALLTQAMSKTLDRYALQSLAKALSSLAERMDRKGAAALCRQAATGLAEAMSKTTNLYDLKPLLQGLLSLTTHLDPTEAAALCRQAAASLTEAMSKTMDPDTLHALAREVSALSGCLDPREAAALCRPVTASLAQAMSRTPDPATLQSLSHALSLLAARMDPREATALCRQAAASLAEALGKPMSPPVAESLSKELSWLAARLEPREAITTLTQVMSKTANPRALSSLSQGLVEVGGRMEPKEVTAILTEVLNKTENPYRLSALSQALAGLAARLDPEEAAVVCARASAFLSQAMSKPTDPVTLVYLSRGLSAVSVWMEPREAAVVCSQAATILSLTLRKTPNPDALAYLSQELSAMVSQMEPEKDWLICSQAAAVLSQSLTETPDPFSRAQLSGGLSALAARMKPKEASQVCGQAAAILGQAISETTNPYALMRLTQGLLAVAAHLEPNEAAAVCAQAAAVLFQASQTMASSVLHTLSQAMPAILVREVPTTSHERFLGVVAMVAGLADSGVPFLALACARPALQPLPPPLPAQMLVDLLKNPFCVGEARRLVLDQLARHYHRPFADQWEFVDYVHQHKLDLDLTTPPQRPALPKNRN